MVEAMIDPVTGEIIDQKELAEQLLAQAKKQGVSLVGPGGLLNQLTKNVLETALEAELTEHLGHEHGETPIAANMRNGTPRWPSGHRAGMSVNDAPLSNHDLYCRQLGLQ
jgi:hypothetical protein